MISPAGESGVATETSGRFAPLSQMTGYSTTVLTMLSEALGAPEIERQKEALIMISYLFEKHGGGAGVDSPLVEPFNSAELSDEFVDYLFSIVRSKAIEERTLEPVRATALWTLGKHGEMRSLAAVCAVVTQLELSGESCYQAAVAMEHQLAKLSGQPTAHRLVKTALPYFAKHREKDARLQEVALRLEALATAA